MIGFILRRMIQAVVVLLVVAFVSFVLFNYVGDPINGMVGQDTSIADRARFDNFYIENWSMWGDVKIMMRTFGQLLKAAGR